MLNVSIVRLRLLRSRNIAIGMLCTTFLVAAIFLNIRDPQKIGAAPADDTAGKSLALQPLKRISGPYRCRVPRTAGSDAANPFALKAVNAFLIPPPAPPRPIRDDDLPPDDEGGGARCGGRGCQHTYMACGGDATIVAVSGCCFKCCWRRSENCSEEACCESE